jgi:hypothetical protein
MISPAISRLAGVRQIASLSLFRGAGVIMHGMHEEQRKCRDGDFSSHSPSSSGRPSPSSRCSGTDPSAITVGGSLRLQSKAVFIRIKT